MKGKFVLTHNEKHEVQEVLAAILMVILFTAATGFILGFLLCGLWIMLAEALFGGVHPGPDGLTLCMIISFVLSVVFYSIIFFVLPRTKK